MNKSFLSFGNYIIIVILFHFSTGSSQPVDFDKIQFVNPDTNNPFNKYLSRGYVPENRIKDGVLYTGTDTVICEIEKERIMVILSFSAGLIQNISGYYGNSQKYSMVNFKNGRAEGYEEGWYSTGEKRSKMFFIDGKVEGPMLSWYKNGNLEFYTFGKMDDCPAISQKFYENGNLHIESYKIFCCDSNDMARQRVWYDDGFLFSDAYYNKGKQKYITYYKNGNKGVEGTYYDMLLYAFGKWTEYYESGKKKSEKFYNDGTKPEEANFKIGRWSWWDEKGNLTKQEIYKNNELIETKEFLPGLKLKEK